MPETVRAAWVIARRDYVATVLSRTFLLFLIGPLLPIIFGGIFGLASSQGSAPAAAAQPYAAIAAGDDARWLAAAAARLDPEPGLRIVPAHGPLLSEVHGLIEQGAPAVLAGSLDAPHLYAAADALSDAGARLTPLIAEAREQRALAATKATPPPVTITRTSIAQPPQPGGGDHREIARGGQFVLILLTIMLAGMLLWNLLEEKSNKVLDILVSAVPVDAIFLGKLAAMVAMSLTFIAVWGTIAAIGIAIVVHMGVLPPALGLPAPAIGWLAFLLLGLAYFTTSYLLLGAVFLGVGSQARTAREVQTLTLPATMGQVVVFGVASSAIGAPDGRLAWGAMLFPWSSPFAMYARAAERPEIWPHLIGLAWQALWIAVAVRLASRLFRRSVLNATPFVGRRR